MKRTAIKRSTKPMKKMGAKMKKDLRELRAVKPQLLERSHGVCEVCFSARASGHPHHIQRRSQGGDNSLENLLDTCDPCHRRIHDNPEWALEAEYLKRAESSPWKGLTSSALKSPGLFLGKNRER